ncbi:PAS domain-containing sensor histidine kinase [Phaeobacter sp. B1627]|uniref:PAS domain-containing sensor histidine kinase n=1 Tax=Phaeobacter sp. B1627 TaxID=2583809 RepID=UPI00111870CB|nr:PAS domain-containing sensor histidine kinase [Phaeobacter sp. B1627]TNJ41050.1 hypothetical protein FGE21_15470 [Phaeobacter sp. B1627]
MTPDEKALLDQIEQAIFVLEPDRDGIPRYVAFNRYGLSHIQRTEDEVLGLTIRDLFPGQYGETIYQHHLRILRTAMPYAYQSHLPLHDSVHQIEVTLRPIIGDRGQVRRIVGTTKDISSLDTLHDLQLGAEMFQTEIEDFVSLAAHDLRTPIRHVSTIAGMLRDDFVDLGDGKLELIDMLEQIGIKAMNLIADILSHAQATSTKSDIRTFSLANLVKEVVALLDPMGLCTHTVSGDWVVGDRAATLIILRNLVDNAIKHTGSEIPGALHIDVCLTDAGPGFYRIEVRDNGPGLKEASALLLNTGTLRTEGGFGLQGVHRLLQARGGQIEATNAATGAGAVIRFTLPGKVLSEETALTPDPRPAN